MDEGKIRAGWAALAAVSALLFLVILLGATVGVLDGFLDGAETRATWSLLRGLAELAFCWWIGMGSWRRAIAPTLPREPGEAAYAKPEVGPWGWVGRILLGLMVVGFGVVLVIGNVSDRRAHDRAERVRDRALVVADVRHVTVAQVREARERWISMFGEAKGGSPLDQLLPIAGASVANAHIGDDGTAVVVVHPDGGSPCVEVTIADDAEATAELHDRCR
ncbi:MAG: hypothetical protein JWM89_853 [Acidimicrobiales bacterium]|nr:hypothetical protein [Acidimicrobiales bacterium]